MAAADGFSDRLFCIEPGGGPLYFLRGGAPCCEEGRRWVSASRQRLGCQIWSISTSFGPLAAADGEGGDAAVA
jgi:hypothetical protein